MGNQPSKEYVVPEKKANATAAPGVDGPASHQRQDSLQQLPSFTRSDTKESTRSLKASLRSKIPGSIRTDSPRSSSFFNGDAVDGCSIRSGRSGRSGRPKLNRADSSASLQSATAPSFTEDEDTTQPPPSPIHSSSMRSGQGRNKLSAAQASGEVDNVSDQPPSGGIDTKINSQAGQSILIKREGVVNPVHNTPRKEDSSVMAMNEIMDMDLDDFIKRLLDAAYSGKVTKSACLKNAEITAICQRAREVLLSQPALLELDAPVKIVGDVHGQYTDLIRMFEMCGFPPSANFLFLGDYVDRGKQSLETILLLLCYKLKYPENFFLLRGNHECANVTRVYGFYDECKRRCNVKIWKTFVDTFNCLPIAAIVANKIFCVHGGLSPALSHMDDIRNIARPTDVPDYGLLNDLLWSDPADMEQDWEANERGVSYCFGKKVILNFLVQHDFDLVCRAHMVVEDGYEFFADRVLVTVFSAPNVSFGFPSLTQAKLTTVLKILVLRGV